MKQLIIILISLICLQSYGQGDTVATNSEMRLFVPKQIADSLKVLKASLPGQTLDIAAINSLIDAKLRQFDSIIYKTVTTGNAANTTLDTLPAPAVGSAIKYRIEYSAASGGNYGGGAKTVTIRNSGGTISIWRDMQTEPYRADTALLNARLTVVIVNNVAIVRVNGIAGISIIWNSSKQKVL